MSNLTVSRQGPEVQLDTELPYDERLGRNVVEVDPWRATPKTKAPEIYAGGVVLTAVWLVGLIVTWLLRTIFCWGYGCFGTEALLANALAWGWTFLPVAAVFVGGVVWATGAAARQRAEAQRMSITRDRFGNPVAAQLVLAKTPDWAAAELALATRAEVEMAPHRTYRGIDSLSVSYNNGGGKAATEAAALLEATPNVGPLPTAEWTALVDKVPHAMLAAKTGGGKSTLARFLLRPRLEAEEQLFIIDPHWSPSNWNGLPGVGAGEDWAAIAAAFDAVVSEYQRRLDEYAADKPTSDFRRLTVLVDEVAITKLAFERQGKNNPWTRFVTVLGSGARKVRVSVILLTQSTNVADLGISGPLRENYTRIALDARCIRQLVEDDGSKERREALYAALPSQGDFPAATEINGEVYFLDRRGVTEASFPPGAEDCIWEPARSSFVPAEEPDELLNGLIRTHAHARTVETTPLDVVDRLRELRAAGVTRQQAREDLKLKFTDAQWTEAGK